MEYNDRHIFNLNLNPYKNFEIKTINNKKYKLNVIKDLKLNSNIQNIQTLNTNISNIEDVNFNKINYNKFKNFQKYEEEDFDAESYGDFIDTNQVNEIQDIQLDSNSEDEDNKTNNVESCLINNLSNINANINQYNNNIKQTSFSHYLYIPIDSTEFINKYNNFKELILNEKLPDINLNMFQAQNKLHVTICCLKLENLNSVVKIEKLIREFISNYKQKLLETKDKILYLNFENIDMLKCNNNKAKVVYTKPLEDKNLEYYRDFIDELINFIYYNNLVDDNTVYESHINYNSETKRYENDLIHCTLINKKFNNNNNNNNYFNGYRILKKVKCCFNGFGLCKIDKICLKSFNDGKQQFEINI